MVDRGKETTWIDFQMLPRKWEKRADRDGPGYYRFTGWIADLGRKGKGKRKTLAIFIGRGVYRQESTRSIYWFEINIPIGSAECRACARYATAVSLAVWKFRKRRSSRLDRTSWKKPRNGFASAVENHTIDRQEGHCAWSEVYCPNTLARMKTTEKKFIYISSSLAVVQRRATRRNAGNWLGVRDATTCKGTLRGRACANLEAGSARKCRRNTKRNID